jgi:hypothetical protein
MSMSDSDKVTLYKWIVGGYVVLRVAKITADVVKYKYYNEVNDVVETAATKTAEIFDGLTLKKEAP